LPVFLQIFINFSAMEQARRQVSPTDARTARYMYLGGFFFLPWLWLVNFVCYRHTLKLQGTPEPMRKHVFRSLLCFTLAMALWLAWLIFFYLNSEQRWAKKMLVFDPETFLAA